MLIKVSNTTLNVTEIEKIIVNSKEVTKVTKLSWCKKQKEKITDWDLVLYYKDGDGSNETFTWTNCGSYEQVKKLERELLDQIKEVELEHMSAALENAIRKN